MDPINIRTYSRKDRPGTLRRAKATNDTGNEISKRIPLKTRPRVIQQRVFDYASKPHCKLFNAVYGVRNDSVDVSPVASQGGLGLGLEQGSPEVFLHQASSESSLGISVDSTFDKLLKGKPTKSASQCLGLGPASPILPTEHITRPRLTLSSSTESLGLHGVMNGVEKEVPPMYSLLPYSLEVHTDEELPSPFLKTPSKLQDTSLRKLKAKISQKHDLYKIKVGKVRSQTKKNKCTIKRSPAKCSYQLRSRLPTKYYLSDVGTSLSSSNSPLKTSTSELHENQENLHSLGEECRLKANLCAGDKLADHGRLTISSTSTPLKESKKSILKSNISYLSPISFHENCVGGLSNNLTNTLESTGVSSQDGTNCGSINVSLSLTRPDVKKVGLSQEVENAVSTSSTDLETSCCGSPFKGWSLNELQKDLVSKTKFQLFDIPSIDLLETHKTASNLSLCKESKEHNLPLAGNVIHKTELIPSCSNNPLSDANGVLLSKEEIKHSSSEAPGNTPEFSVSAVNSKQDPYENIVMSARGHRLQWCTQPMPDLEDEGILDAIEEEGEDYLPLGELPRGSCFKRFKGASSSLHVADTIVSRASTRDTIVSRASTRDTIVSRASTRDTSMLSFRRSSIYSHRKSRLSHIVIPGKLLAQPKPQSRSFRDLYGITANEPSETLPSPRDLDGVFQDEDFSRPTYTEDNGVTARNVVLQRCNQHVPVPFSEAFSETYWNNCRKIGEGVYGEVFMWQDGGRSAVLKIIPIEGDYLVNGERQKKFSEILSEIVITTELSNLRTDSQNQTNGFTEVLQNWCIQDKYPEQLVKLWKQYAEEGCSENDCPDVFSESQLFIVLELANGGEDLEKFQFSSAKQSKSILLQTAYALAVAEKSLEFEHRDLHWGNVLISRTREKLVTFKLDNRLHSIPTHGVQVTIIDFTLSRMTYDGCCIFNDLSQDPGLFDSHGDYQFDIYRSMREECSDNWNEFVPFTNVLWLHYLVDKMTASAALGVHYHNTRTKVHQKGLKMLKDIRSSLLSHSSAVDFVQSLDINIHT